MEDEGLNAIIAKVMVISRGTARSPRRQKEEAKEEQRRSDQAQAELLAMEAAEAEEQEQQRLGSVTEHAAHQHDRQRRARCERRGAHERVLAVERVVGFSARESGEYVAE